MSTVAFLVPGQPQGKGRPRVGKVAGHVRMFTPPKTESYEALIALFAHQAMQGRPLIAGPVQVDLWLVYGIPASWSKKKRAQAEQGAIWPTTKPDVDNVIKAYCDAINKVVWVDDAQVVKLRAHKAYGDAPGVQVLVSALVGVSE